MATNDDILNAVKNGGDFDMSNMTRDQVYAMLKASAPVRQQVNYKQCYTCGNTFPPADLVTRTVEVEVGRTSGAPNISGSLFSFGGKPGKSVRVGYSAGRTHYRNKNVLVCKGCIRNEQDKQFQADLEESKATQKFLIFFAILCVIIFFI